MPSRTTPLTPHDTHEPNSIRKIYIQNLTDLLHVCLLRGEVQRAKRAWGILVRCREVDWRSRWYWGLQILNTSTDTSSPSSPRHTQTQGTLPSQLQSQSYEGRDIEKWLTGLRISAKEEDKPSLLHAVVLHLIKWERYRAALDELETYLSSYPYLLSAPLHTYAGMLAFYLAQPASALQSETRKSTRNRNTKSSASQSSEDADGDSDASAIAARTRRRRGVGAVREEQVNQALVRSSRAYFVKALALDSHDELAAEFIFIIDNPQKQRVSVDEDDHREQDEGAGSGADDDEWGVFDT